MGETAELQVASAARADGPPAILLDKVNKIGTTVVMATHDRSIVDTMRRRVIELDRGSIVRDQARSAASLL